MKELLLFCLILLDPVISHAGPYGNRIPWVDLSINANDIYDVNSLDLTVRGQGLGSKLVFEVHGNFIGTWRPDDLLCWEDCMKENWLPMFRTFFRGFSGKRVYLTVNKSKEILQAYFIE